MGFTMIALLETIFGLWILGKVPKKDIPASPSLESVDCKNISPYQQFDASKYNRFRLIRQHWATLTSNKNQSPSDVVHKLKRLDGLFLVVIPTAYIIFVSVMFASNSSWEDPKVPGEPDKFATWLY